jgi:hypothetical protein
MVTRSHVSLLGPGQPVELPRPARSAAPLVGLALVALLLAFASDVPRVPAVVAALAFLLAGLARAGHERHALGQLRATVDGLIARDLPAPCSPLLTWRCSELSSTEAREQLAGTIARIERAAAPSSLPGSAPINRRAVRMHHDELAAIVDRLLLPEPVSARGVLLVRRLLADPAGPLYDPERATELGDQLRQAFSALEGHASLRRVPR